MEKKFYKKAEFYLTALALALVVVALALYSGNCASEFNKGKVSPSVVAGDIVAIVLIAIALAMFFVKSFAKNLLLSEIADYRRFATAFAFCALIYAFLMSILDEYQLLGTILYPIFSGAIGDPVDPVLSGSYFGQLICNLAALVVTLVASLNVKKQVYSLEASNKATDAAVRA